MKSFFPRWVLVGLLYVKYMNKYIMSEFKVEFYIVSSIRRMFMTRFMNKK